MSFEFVTSLPPHVVSGVGMVIDVCEVEADDGFVLVDVAVSIESVLLGMMPMYV